MLDSSLLRSCLPAFKHPLVMKVDNGVAMNSNVLMQTQAFRLYAS